MVSRPVGTPPMMTYHQLREREKTIAALQKENNLLRGSGGERHVALSELYACRLPSMRRNIPDFERLRVGNERCPL